MYYIAGILLVYLFNFLLLLNITEACNYLCRINNYKHSCIVYIFLNI